MSLYRWFVGGSSSWTDQSRQRQWAAKDEAKARRLSAKKKLASAKKKSGGGNRKNLGFGLYWE